jgi:heme-degrading monooxygenase HmoA
MIARMWRGPVRKAQKQAYIEYLKETGLSDYAHTGGNRGVWLLCQDKGAEVEFTTLTLWDSVASIKAFAGEDYERARYYPRDREFLTRFDPKVEHFEVVEVAPRQR